MDLSEVLEAQPLDVACPSCDADAGMRCAEPRFGQEGLLIDFHDSRHEAAANTLVCPQCASTNVARYFGVASAGEYTQELCDDCGWRSEPY